MVSDKIKFTYSGKEATICKVFWHNNVDEIKFKMPL